MRRRLLLGCVIALGLMAVPGAALATTQTQHSGSVSAAFSWSGTYPKITHQKLVISQAGTVVYDAPVTSSYCGTGCAPASTLRRMPSVHVVNLEGNGRPDVVLDLFTGGAHCCFVEQVFSLDPTTMTYVENERDFGDPGDYLSDLNHDGRDEFVTADDNFAYEFTDYAASGLPIEILSYSQGRFEVVTRSYPKLVRSDAAMWMKTFRSLGRDHYGDSVGVVAAWAADEDTLGHSRQVSRFLAFQLKRGHLRSALAPQAPGGKQFVTRLQRFLRRLGYLR